jgi:flavin-binding protein dodecin
MSKKSNIKKTIEEVVMADQENKVYRITKVVGTSNVGFDDGVKRAIERAQTTLRHVQWFEVKEQRGRITDAGIEYQVALDIGFLIEEKSAH